MTGLELFDETGPFARVGELKRTTALATKWVQIYSELNARWGASEVTANPEILKAAFLPTTSRCKFTTALRNRFWSDWLSLCHT